jgi:hypothetical protein
MQDGGGTSLTSAVRGVQQALSVQIVDNLGNQIIAFGGGTAFNTPFPSSGTAMGAEFLSTPPTLITGQMVPLQTDVNGNLKVNIIAGGGAGGGTSSNFGAAFPALGTAIGGEYLSSPPTLTSGQMVALQTDSAGNLKSIITQGGNSATVIAPSIPPSSSSNQASLLVSIRPDSQNVNGQALMAASSPVTWASDQNRPNKGVQQTAITTAAVETTIITAGAAGVFRDLYGLILANTGATATSVTIKDATTGTTRMILQVPAGDTRGFMLPCESAIPQAVAANNWTATLGSSTTSLQVTALWVKN